MLGNVHMGNWEGMVLGKILGRDVGKRDYGKLGRYGTWEDMLGCWET
jgi:hypothetical protein